MDPLTNDQLHFVLDKFGKWLDVKSQYEIDRPASRPDVDHSHLLRHLLKGGEIFPDPPPSNHGSPDYDLAAGKSVKVRDFHERIEAIPQMVYVNQCAYEWINKEQGICRYMASGILFQITETWITENDDSRLERYIQMITTNGVKVKT